MMKLESSNSHVFIVSNIHIASRVDCHSTRVHKLTVPLTNRTYAVQNVSPGTQKRDTVTTKFSENISTLEVGSYSNWRAEETLLRTGSAESVPESTVGIEDLETTVVIVTDDKMTFPVEAQSSGKVETASAFSR